MVADDAHATTMLRQAPRCARELRTSVTSAQERNGAKPHDSEIIQKILGAFHISLQQRKLQQSAKIILRKSSL